MSNNKVEELNTFPPILQRSRARARNPGGWLQSIKHGGGSISAEVHLNGSEITFEERKRQVLDAIKEAKETVERVETRHNQYLQVAGSNADFGDVPEKDLEKYHTARETLQLEEEYKQAIVKGELKRLSNGQ